MRDATDLLLTAATRAFSAASRLSQALCLERETASPDRWDALLEAHDDAIALVRRCTALARELRDTDREEE